MTATTSRPHLSLVAATRRARTGRGVYVRRLASALLAAGFLIGTLFLPIGTVVWTSIGHPAGHAYATQIQSATTRVILERTVMFAGLTTFVTVVIAFPVAYGLTLAPSRLRTVLLTLIVFPYLTSLLVRTYAWIGLLGFNGPVAKIATWFGASDKSWVGSGTGVLLVLLHVYLPFVILATYVAMRRIDKSHILAGHSLGASPLDTFWRVFAPQARAGVVAGAVLVFIITVGMYAVPALIGGPDQTTLAMLVVQEVTSGYGLPQDVPAAQAILLCSVVLVALLVGARFIGLGSLVGVQAQRPSRKRQAETLTVRHMRRPIVARIASRLPGQYSRRHLIVALATLIALVIIEAPFVYLLGMSFEPLPLLTFPTSNLSGRWYSEVLSDPAWRGAAVHSLQVGLAATGIATVLGWYLARLSVRRGHRAAGWVTVVVLVPLVIPGVLYATGIYTIFVKVHLVGRWYAIAIAHSVLALPYAYINILNGLSAYDGRLDQAAHSLGASTARRFFRVTLPILRPALLTAAFLAFLLSLDELIVALFLAPLTYKTLPLAFWSASNQNVSPALAAVGVLLELLVGAVLVIGWTLTRRTRRWLRPRKEAQA